MIRKLEEAFLAGYRAGDAAGSLVPHLLIAGEAEKEFQKWLVAQEAADQNPKGGSE